MIENQDNLGDIQLKTILIEQIHKALDEDIRPHLRAQALWNILDVLDNRVVSSICRHYEDVKMFDRSQQVANFGNILTHLLNDYEDLWGKG